RAASPREPDAGRTSARGGHPRARADRAQRGGSAVEAPEIPWLTSSASTLFNLAFPWSLVQSRPERGGGGGTPTVPIRRRVGRRMQRTSHSGEMDVQTP